MNNITPKVLVASGDDLALQDVADELLKTSGVRVDYAKGVEHSWDKIKRLMPAVVLIDDSLEGAMELCEKIKGNSSTSGIHTVMFPQSPEDVNTSISEVDEWYAKPYDVGEVTGAIIEYLDRN